MRYGFDVLQKLRQIVKVCGKLLNLAAFGALIKRKRGEARLTQETLAQDVFGDSTRKADISRLENGKTTPQEATIQKLCKALNISAAELEPIRQSRDAAKQLDMIPSLSREDLENLAGRFNIETPFDRSDDDLRQQLTFKAKEYRALKAEVDTINEDMKRLANLKAAAQDAIARVDLDEVEALLSMVQETELEEAAKTAELRSNNALLRGNVDQAFDLLESAANSFGAIGTTAKAERKILRYFAILRNHGLRYGGQGLPLSQALIERELTEDLKNDNAWLWAAGKNSLAVSLQEQGIRTTGADGADLLSQAVAAYRAALQVRTQADHPVNWAMTQNNLGNTLSDQGTRTSGADGADLLTESVTAYRAALQVRTQANHPVDWAMTQENIAVAHCEISEHDSCDTTKPELQNALVAIDAALTVYDPEHMSYDYGTATELRKRILAKLDALP